MNSARSSLKRMIATVAAVLMTVACAALIPLGVAQAVPEPDLGAVIAGDALGDGAVGQHWVDDVTSGVTVQVFDAGGALLGTEVGYPGEPDPDGYNWFGVGFGLQFEAGYRLMATGNDSGYSIEMTVTDLSVTDVDLENGTVSGTTSYYGTGEVTVELYSGPAWDQRLANAMVPKQGPVDGLYTWTADFSGVIDLPAVGMYGQAIDSDAAVNAGTLVHYSAGGLADRPGLKTIHANMESYDSVFTYGWEIGSPLTLTIDDPDTSLTPDLAIVREFTEDPFFFNIAELLTIEAGQTVSVTDGTTTVQHVVGPLQITSANRATGVVTGLATPGIPVELIPTDGEDFLGVYYTDPATDGSWQIQAPAGVLSAAGWLMSNQFETADPNEDSETQYDWYFAQPSMNVCVNCDSVEGFDWPSGTEVTLTIDDPDTPDTDYQDTETVGADPAGSVGNIGFVFADSFDVLPGHIVALDDGQTHLSHTVQTVEVTTVDAAADTISGTADAGDQIRVFANPEYGGHDVTVEAQANGTWVATFAGILDLVPGVAGGAEEGDPNPDVPAGTTYAWDIPETGLLFSGFSTPVDDDGVNLATAGRTVPLKFRVTTGTGDPVTDLANVRVSVTDLECDLGTTGDQVEEYAAGDSGLQNLGDGYYQYNWKTPKSYRDSCKMLTLDLGDGVPHTAEFHFPR